MTDNKNKANTKSREPRSLIRSAWSKIGFYVNRGLPKWYVMITEIRK